MTSPIFENRVRETTTTRGTGAVTLNGAVSGYRRFSFDGEQYYYCIAGGGQWEVGLGTYSAGPPRTLTRSWRDSSTGGLLNLTGRSMDVFNDVPASLFGPIANVVTVQSFTGTGNFGPSTAYTVGGSDAFLNIGVYITWTTNPTAGSFTATLGYTDADANNSGIVSTSINFGTATNSGTWRPIKAKANTNVTLTMTTFGVTGSPSINAYVIIQSLA